MTPETSAAVSTGYATAATTAKARFLRAYEREHATTRKVLRAFPSSKSEFRPHERSNSALKLAWTFVVEERVMLKGLRNEQILGGAWPAAPETWDAVLSAFDKQYDDVVAQLRDPSNPSLEGTVGFMVGPKQTGDYALEDFLWFMLSDQIHHRGQLSVYVRMTGGQVPSIYGPSADEPWS